LIVVRPKRLEPYVEKMVWQGNGTDKPYVVYPDIYHVMGFQNVGNVMLIRDNQIRPLECAGITGIHMDPKTFQSTMLFSSVLVYFKPEALFRWHLCQPKEIGGTSLGLRDVWLRESEWDGILNLQAEANPYVFLNHVEQLIWKQFCEVEIDPWAKWAVNQIISSQGSIRIADLAEDTVLSRRQFSRRFIERVGIAPKSFVQIVKFRHVIELADSATNLTDLAYEGGYFDQSHFIKDFRKRSGISPRDIFQKGKLDPFN
jgi:AraC-like DNA-binding protein